MIPSIGLGFNEWKEASPSAGWPFHAETITPRPVVVGQRGHGSVAVAAVQGQGGAVVLGDLQPEALCPGPKTPALRLLKQVPSDAVSPMNRVHADGDDSAGAPPLVPRQLDDGETRDSRPVPNDENGAVPTGEVLPEDRIRERTLRKTGDAQTPDFQKLTEPRRLRSLMGPPSSGVRKRSPGL